VFYTDRIQSSLLFRCVNYNGKEFYRKEPRVHLVFSESNQLRGFNVHKSRLHVFGSKTILPKHIWSTHQELKETGRPIFCRPNDEAVEQTLGHLPVSPDICWPNVCWPNVCWPNVCWPKVFWPKVCHPIACQPNACQPNVRWPNVCWPIACQPNVCWLNVCWPNACQPRYLLAKCLLAKCLLAKCLSSKCLSSKCLL
jgi:hypothetical protein